MKKINSILILLLFSTSILLAQKNGNKEVNEGNEAYRKGNFSSAIDFYNQALTVNPNNEYAKINKAIALNKSNKIEDATKLYNDALKTTNDKQLQSTINYNMGVNDAKEKKYKEAIAEFKDALRKTPNDQQARENLQLAINKLKEEQKNNGGGKDNNQNQNQNQNQDKNQQNQQDKEQQENQQNNSGMNKQQAERYLDNLKEEEKNLQNKIMKRAAGQGQRENQKGW